MNTLEEFEKRLSNLLDFVEEKKDELTYKHNLGLYLNCLHIKDGNSYSTGVAIGNPFEVSTAICCFLKKQPQLIEFMGATIEIAKGSSKR